MEWLATTINFMRKYYQIIFQVTGRTSMPLFRSKFAFWDSVGKCPCHSMPTSIAQTRMNWISGFVHFRGFTLTCGHNVRFWRPVWRSLGILIFWPSFGAAAAKHRTPFVPSSMQQPSFRQHIPTKLARVRADQHDLGNQLTWTSCVPPSVFHPLHVAWWRWPVTPNSINVSVSKLETSTAQIITSNCVLDSWLLILLHGGMWKHRAQTLTGTCCVLSWLLRVSLPFWTLRIGDTVRKHKNTSFYRQCIYIFSCGW